MFRLSIIASTALVALVTLAPAKAEVRIQDRNGLSLEQRALGGGIWSSRQPSARGVLNAAGDLLGDGAPAHAVRDGVLLAAWVRPADDTIRLSLAVSATGVEMSAVAGAEGAAGVPIVMATGSAVAPWALAWQAFVDGAPSIQLAGVAGRGGPASTLAEGLLVGAVSVGDAVHVLGLRGEQLTLSSAVFVHLPDIPDDIPLVRLTGEVTIDLEDHFLPHVPGDSSLARAGGNGRLGEQAHTHLAGWRPLGRAVACEVPHGAWLALQVGPGVVAELALDEAGVMGMSLRRGALPRCP